MQVGPTGRTQLQPRPWVFVVLFWSALGFSYVTFLVNLLLGALDIGAAAEYPGSWRGFVVATAALAATITCWVLLPWDPRAGVRPTWTAAGFLGCVCLFAWSTGMGYAQLLFLVAVGQGGMVLGRRPGLAYAATVLAAATGVLVVSWPGETAARLIWQVGLLALAAAFVIGVSNALAAAVRAAQDEGRLLDELRAVHDELARHAGVVSDLAVAQERTRLARELHDSVGHHLTVVNLQLQNAQRFAALQPEEAWAEVRDARRSTLGALAEVRRAVRALEPLDLQTRTVSSAIDALVTVVNGPTLSAAMAVTGTERALPPEVEVVLYRAAQEALSNAAKHSSGDRVHVTLRFEAACVSLVVTDDGGVRTPAPLPGFGLSSITGRVEALGGVVRIGAQDGGFTLTVEVPTPHRASVGRDGE